MPTHLGWTQIAIRLALTFVAGALIGTNRWQRGRAAGMRTTILVCLAASVSMIQMNRLLLTVGKAPDSFVVMDIMRLPLGILTGMGFIGAGAILHRGHLVVGVTTAATLWFATVIGLCFGGGQIEIGLVASALCLIVLWCFPWLESRLRRERLGTVNLALGSDAAETELLLHLTGMGFRIVSWTMCDNASPGRRLQCQVRWTPDPRENGVPEFVKRLAERHDVVGLEWQESLPPGA